MLFFFLSFFIIFFAAIVVSTKNILHSALALIACFFTTAALYILLNAEFIAIAQILVYIGGIVIFIVYAILLTTQLGETFLKPSLFKKVSAGFISLAMLITLTMYFLNKKDFIPSTLENENLGKLTEIGIRFLKIDAGGFIIPFEVISVLLLAAMIGAIIIAKPEK